MERSVLVFAKVPGKGIAKSRIAATEGEEMAAAVYCELLRRTSGIVEGCEYHVAFTGAGHPGLLRNFFPGARSFFRQADGSLGNRLVKAFAHLFRRGYRRVVAIGCDCPACGPDDLERAFRTLEQDNDAVIGPAEDGGYYLAGCRKRALSMFEVEGWGTDRLLEETVRALAAGGYAYAFLDRKYDVDTIEDYRRWKSGNRSNRKGRE